MDVTEERNIASYGDGSKKSQDTSKIWEPVVLSRILNPFRHCPIQVRYYWVHVSLKADRRCRLYALLFFPVRIISLYTDCFLTLQTEQTCIVLCSGTGILSSDAGVLIPQAWTVESEQVHRAVAWEKESCG